MEITGYTWEKSCGSFRFMMESWIFKSNIEWKLLVWNVVLPMERFIHIHLDLADYKVIKTNDKHALLKPSVPIHSTRRPANQVLGLPLNLLFWTRKYFKEVSRLSLPLNLLILEMLKSTCIYYVHLKMHLLHLAHLTTLLPLVHISGHRRKCTCINIQIKIKHIIFIYLRELEIQYICKSLLIFILPVLRFKLKFGEDF